MRRKQIERWLVSEGVSAKKLKSMNSAELSEKVNAVFTSLQNNIMYKENRLYSKKTIRESVHKLLNELDTATAMKQMLGVLKSDLNVKKLKGDGYDDVQIIDQPITNGGKLITILKKLGKDNNNLVVATTPEEGIIYICGQISDKNKGGGKAVFNFLNENLYGIEFVAGPAQLSKSGWLVSMAIHVEGIMELANKNPEIKKAVQRLRTNKSVSFKTFKSTLDSVKGVLSSKDGNSESEVLKTLRRSNNNVGKILKIDDFIKQFDTGYDAIYDDANKPSPRIVNSWDKNEKQIQNKWTAVTKTIDKASEGEFPSSDEFLKFVDEQVLNEKFLKLILKIYKMLLYTAQKPQQLRAIDKSFDSVLKKLDKIGEKLKDSGVKVVQTKSFDDVNKDNTAEDLPKVADAPVANDKSSGPEKPSADGSETPSGKSTGPGNPFKDGPQPPSKSKTSSDDSELSDIAIKAMKDNGVEPGDLTPDDLARLKKLKATKLDSQNLKLSDRDKAEILNMVFANIAKRKTPPKSAFGGAVDKVKNFFKTTFGKKTMNESVNRYFN
jgi:hypothetical protein